MPQKRSETGPFQVEVTKSGLRGLGLNVHMDSNFATIAVKNLASRSPLAKDGNLRYYISII